MVKSSVFKDSHGPLPQRPPSRSSNNRTQSLPQQSSALSDRRREPLQTQLRVAIDGLKRSTLNERTKYNQISVLMRQLRQHELIRSAEEARAPQAKRAAEGITALGVGQSR